ncbi:hypothetical protein ACF0H5_012900 [Mactra antiquata]
MLLLCALLLLSISTHSVAKTTCVLTVPVPSLDVCDATGTLEEYVDASVHETRGRIKSMQDNGFDIFEIFNEQINRIVNESTNSDMNIKDAQEEILVLKRYITALQAGQVSATTQASIGRRKRAVITTPSTQTIQSLKAANASFQHTVANLMLKLNNISTNIRSEMTNSDQVHIRLQQELTANFQALNTLEQQIKSLSSKVLSALPVSSNKGAGGVNISSVRQEVTSLIINASVEEQIAKRQLDDLAKVTSQLQAKDSVIGSKLSSYQTEVNTINQNITGLQNQVPSLKGGERILEDRIGSFLSNGTQDLANIRADVRLLQADIKKNSGDVLNYTISVSGYEANLKTLRQSVDSVQTLTTLSKKAQQAEVTNILFLKKDLTDSINALKFAFGLTTTPP